MQWSLFLLVLMVQCSFFACHHYEYHFIEENMSWEEAQKYCKKNYTDLATIHDETDMDRLSDLVNHGEAWIGLWSNPGQHNGQWQWSQPGVEFTGTSWHDGEPNNCSRGEYCVIMHNDKWFDTPCMNPHKFICYDETKTGKRFIFIDQEKTWPKAQEYCRTHHTDLVSGLKHLRENDFQNENQTDIVWIGLFKDTWEWSDGSNSSFRNWELFQDRVKKKCAMTVLHTSGKWSSGECQDKKHFFCYDAKFILIKQNKTWTEALDYCREKHHHLATITNPHQQSLVQARAKKADTEYVWVGLLYSCPLDLWFWINDELVCYDNFAPNKKPEDCETRVAMHKMNHKWYIEKEKMKFNFICAV